MRTYFGFFGEHPDAPRLIVHHLSSGDPPPEAAVRHFRRALEAIIGVVRDGQARGEIRAVEPLLAAFTLVSKTVWFAVARRTIATVSGVPMDRPELAQVVERHIIDVVTRVLHPAKEGL